jgi:hypothetical protein
VPLTLTDSAGNSLSAGDFVEIKRIPDWLLKDLPDDEQKELRACVGMILEIEKIDEQDNYVWVGFGSTKDVGDASHYSGHSFVLEPSCVLKSKSR